METIIMDFENLAGLSLFEDLHLTYEFSFPGDDDEEEGNSEPEDDNPPTDEEVVHSPVPTQGGKPR